MNRTTATIIGIFGITAILLQPARAQHQDFYFGNDLSYVNQMEDCGAVYQYQGEPTDPFEIFADQGTNLVRARLWVDPSWWQEPLDQPEGVKPYYSDLEDVKKTFRRAKDEGMEVLLDFHYSDFWADPGRQLIPRDWLDEAHNPEALSDSVYNYTKRVLSELDDEGLMPEFVQVGNETNPGVMVHIPEEDGFDPAETVASTQDWERHAGILNAGIEAVREVGETASTDPKIALHRSDLSGLEWWFGNITDHVTDFDIIGFSYYYAWHGQNIDALESTVNSLRDNFPDYEVMALETGYLWSEDYGGIIDEPDPEYLPVIPEKQLEYMTDYTRAVMRAGGSGVIFWEPAWVDTECVTPWITGSSHTHVAFFHPDDLNFMENGGGRWMNREFYENPHDPKATFKVDMSEEEVADDGVYINGSFTGDEGWEPQPMADEGGGIYSYYTYLPEDAEGGFYFQNGADSDDRETVPEACADWEETDRKYEIPGSDTTFTFNWGGCVAAGAPEEVRATFKVDMAGSGVDYDDGVYITGDITSDQDDWEIHEMEHEREEIYAYETMLSPGDNGAYYYLTTDSWDNYEDYRETVPEACAEWYDSDRGYHIPEEDVIFAHKWGSCEEVEDATSTEPEELAGAFELNQNYPNPFNPVTTISYNVQESAHVKIAVYNSLGQEIDVLVDGNRASGTHHVDFDGSDFSSGLYIYKMTAEGFSQTKAMTLIK